MVDIISMEPLILLWEQVFETLLIARFDVQDSAAPQSFDRAAIFDVVSLMQSSSIAVTDACRSRTSLSSKGQVGPYFH
jgi:hypothetical protein